MRARLEAEKGTWQVLVMDPEGRWAHSRMDVLLVEVSRLGIAGHVAAEAKIAAERILRHQGPTK